MANVYGHAHRYVYRQTDGQIHRHTHRGLYRLVHVGTCMDMWTCVWPCIWDLESSLTADRPFRWILLPMLIDMRSRQVCRQMCRPVTCAYTGINNVMYVCKGTMQSNSAWPIDIALRRSCSPRSFSRACSLVVEMCMDMWLQLAPLLACVPPVYAYRHAHRHV